MSYDDLTARENLIFHARLRDIPEQRVEAVLETVELSNRARGFPREFSHGMRKRLSLARALLSDPNVLLLDEPFTGLDQHSTQTLERIISDRTVVLVTHDPNMSVALCDRFVLLNDGKLVDQIDDPELTPSAFQRAYDEVRA
jgi:ABC-type multidrug transport system ATPase subunit